MMNTSTQFFSTEDNVPKLIAQAAERMPAHVYCRAEGVEVTYAGLAERVHNAAGILHGQGVRADMHVAVMLSHHLDHVVTFFAIMELGAVHIPINTALKGMGLAHIFTHAHPGVLIADAEYAPVLDEVITERGTAMTTIWRRPASVRHPCTVSALRRPRGIPAAEGGAERCQASADPVHVRHDGRRQGRRHA